MECGAGFTYDADTNLTGPEAVRFTMQAAASNGLTLVRAFGHGHDAFKSIILQPRAGVAPVSVHTHAHLLRVLQSCRLWHEALQATSSAILQAWLAFWRQDPCTRTRPC